MDETGVALGVCDNQNCLGDASTAFALVKTPETREWVTIIEIISAVGRRLQALVIFKGQSLQISWFQDEGIPDYRYTVSMNGWTSNDIGLAWLE